MHDLIHILKIHTYICLYSDGTAVCCKINSFVSVLPYNDRLSETLKLRNSPSHAEEAIDLINILSDFCKKVFIYNKRLIIADIHRLREFYLINNPL